MEKPPHGQQYLSYGHGSLLSSCRRNVNFDSAKFMNHHRLQVRFDAYLR
jgi:hypothetical protein